MNITIRKTNNDDIESILKIYSQPEIDNGISLELEQAKKIFKNFQSYPYYKIFVAVSQDQIVGTIAILVMENLGHLGKKSAIFESIAVLPELQGNGIGKTMLKYAINICLKMECYKITLSANLKRKKAHQFYESLGFLQHGISFKYNLENLKNQI